MDRAPLTVLTEDGISVSFDRYARDDRKTAVVICPGFLQSKETETFQRLARQLAERWDVLTMDFRGHGRSSGLYTFSAKETQDLAAVLADARRHYEHLGVLAFSMGAAIAITTLGKFRNAESLVAVSAPMAFEEIENRFWEPDSVLPTFAHLEPGMGVRPGSPFLPKDRPIDLVARIAPIPVLFIHGTADPIVFVRHSKALHSRAHDPKRLELIPDGLHAEHLFHQFPDRFLSLVAGWFATTL